jgi:hypothetical protein
MKNTTREEEEEEEDYQEKNLQNHTYRALNLHLPPNPRKPTISPLA